MSPTPSTKDAPGADEKSAWDTPDQAGDLPTGKSSDDGAGSGTTVKEEKVAADGEASEDYPTGIRLAFIVVALVLSVFLMSLDMVRLPPLSSQVDAC